MVHLDARVDKEAYEAIADLGSIPYARYSSQRVAVNWGGYSMVQAMVEAGADASRSLQNGDHLVFLSGRCYPLSAVSRFESHLQDSPFDVHARAYFLADAGGWHRARYTRRHGFDGISASLGRRDAAPRRLVRRAAYYVNAVRPAPPTSLRPAAGSQWIALPKELFEEAVEAFQERDYRFLRDGYAPDEMAFHTYIYNSDWVSRTEFGRAETLRPPGKTSQLRNFHLLDESMSGEVEWNSALRPDQRSFFARKFDSSRDRRALDLLDRNAGA